MIKLFRKIRQNLLSEGKTGRYLKYAFGEIVLVVIGILIALQINNWNIERKNALKETYYLNSIQTSIQLSQNELNRVIHDAKEISSSAGTLFLIIAHKKYDQLEGYTLDSLMSSARDYSLISLNDAGIQEILNTGSLDIIQDERIRIILASWDERIHKIKKFEAETEYISHDYNDFVNDFIDIKRYISDSLASIVIPEKREALLNDPHFGNYLFRIQYAHDAMHEMYSDEKIFLDSLNTLIDNYLIKKNR